jgi:nucleotide-binding universal stress UspA family protein
MKQLLVPTDFSSSAHAAYIYTLKLASRCGATVHLLHAFSLLENIFIDRASMRKAYNDQQQAEKTSQLDLLVAEGKNIQPDVTIIPHLFTGPIQQVLLSFIEQANIDMVVMGTKGATGLESVLIGSVTAAFIGESPVPVLAIPLLYNGNLPNTIMLAIQDFTAVPETFSKVSDLANLLQAKVKVIVFEYEGESDVKFAEDKSAVSRFCHQLQSQYPNLHLEAEVVEGTDFIESLQDLSRRHGAVILAMITRRRGFFTQIFKPSLTRKIAKITEVPLLAIPTGEII